MKTQVLFLFIAILLSKTTFGDVIMPNTHYVAKCVKITNVEDYPDISLIGRIHDVNNEYSAYVISSSDCLSKGYKYNEFAVYALNKSYLKGKDISKINYRNDPNALPSNIPIEPYMGNVWDSIPISAIEEYYKVVGFSDSKVILHKWKQVTKYNNGKPDLIEDFEYALPAIPLYQKIMVGINATKKQSVIEVYPNPASKNVHLQIKDSYKGTIPVELVTSTGKVVKTLNLNKSGFLLDCDIPVANVAKGAYFVKVQMGKAIEYKKILIK